MSERNTCILIIGLIAIAISALFLNQTELASVSVGAIAGILVPKKDKK